MDAKAARTLDEVLQPTSDTLFPVDLGERAVSINSTDCDGDTLLHVLIWRGDNPGAHLLIENGADVNAVGDMGDTPLHIALRKDNLPIVRAPVAARARADIPFGIWSARPSIGNGEENRSLGPRPIISMWATCGSDAESGRCS
jgi:uncharacterized protein